MKNNQYTLVGLFLLLLFVGCSESARDFNWQEDNAELTGKDLKAWLRKAPFENELKAPEGQSILMTNAQELFPFIGVYHNKVEELNGLGDKDNMEYAKELLIFQDPKWGDLIVTASLLYDTEDIYLNEAHSSSANPILSGMDPIESLGVYYSSRLTETGFVNRKPGHTQALYWADANGRTSLLGFMQRGNLLLEAVIPVLNQQDSLATWNKMKELANSLGLPADSWQSATADQMTPQESKTSFWKDPFVPIIRKTPLALPSVYLKLADTPFQEQEDSGAKNLYHFAYTGKMGPVDLKIQLKDVDMFEEDFNKKNKDITHYTYKHQQIFYTEKAASGRIQGTAMAYAKDKQYLELTYSFPENSAEDKACVHDVLKYVKIMKFD